MSLPMFASYFRVYDAVSDYTHLRKAAMVGRLVSSVA